MWKIYAFWVQTLFNVCFILSENFQLRIKKMNINNLFIIAKEIFRDVNWVWATSQNDATLQNMNIRHLPPKIHSLWMRKILFVLHKNNSIPNPQRYTNSWTKHRIVGKYFWMSSGIRYHSHWWNISHILYGYFV